MRTGNFLLTKAAMMLPAWSSQCEDSAQRQDKTVQEDEQPMQNTFMGCLQLPLCTIPHYSTRWNKA